MARQIEPTTVDCPSCGHDVLNAQGIRTCSTCNWVTTEYR